MDIRAAIEQLQDELNMKQTDLAFALGVSKVTVNRWMQKKSTPSRALALSILTYAKAHGASTVCLSALEQALMPSAQSATTIDDLRYVRMDQINHLANESSNAIFVCDDYTWELLYVNQATSAIAGLPVEQAEGKKCYEYLFHRDSPCPECGMQELARDGFRTREYCSPVTSKRYMTRSKLITWNGKDAMINYITDITEFRAAGEKQGNTRQEAPAGQRGIAGGGRHTVLIVDDQLVNRRILHRLLEADYRILEAENGAMALEVLRANSSTISAVLLDIVMPVLDGYGVLAAMREDPALCKIPVIVSSQKDGDEAEVQALSLGAQDFIAKPYKGDIIRHRLENTIRLRETAALANRAEKDELTGALSKPFFTEQVALLLRQNPDKKYDMFCFDVARFKLVSDTYGVNTGDDLLRYIARVLQKSPCALLTSRFSADHFYQLAEHAAEDEEINGRLHDFIAEVRKFPIEMQLNVNCGVYRIKDIHADVNGMCDRAKLASDANRSHVEQPFSYYDDSLRQKLVEEQFITGAMKAGIEENQFIVYYQPKYDLHTEMVAGAEALVRWVHPERGFMSPGTFIPIFEKNGFITQLDRYVWEQACKDIRSWMDRGLPPVPISVNVSRADIFNPHLPEILTGLIKKYEIPIPYLHLEITESAYTDNPEQIIAVVGELHTLGFTIEMDDFGSGYSSLNMLAEMPVDILKLDMRFVQTETTHSSGRGIMSFVISLAKWMKLSVIAEGVETAEQIETLRSMDCNFVQGFYYAKPMPLADFETTLTTVAVSALADAKKMLASPGEVHHAGARNGRVMLIVDDIEVNRAVLNSMFCNEYDIVEKSNGQQALEYLREFFDKVDIVLLDLLMPVMDGFQLLKKMHADDNLRGIPVIVTSQGNVTAEERALDLGADDFISKPYSPQIVRHRVRNVVQIYHVQHSQQQELNETRKREQTLMESIPGGVATYHVKKDGRVATEYVSEGLARICGYTPEEFIAHIREDALCNVIPEDIPRLRAAAQNALHNHTLLHELQHIYTKDGNVIPVRMDASIVPPGDQRHRDPDDVALLYAVHTKVAEDTESVLQEQYRYRYILDNLDVAYFELDADGRFYSSDKYSLYEMSEEKPEDILTDGGTYEGIHPEDLPIFFEFLARKKSNLPKITATMRLKMKDGSYRWTEVMGFYEYDATGKREKSIGLLRDVDTEWQNQNRKLQEALEAAEKASAAKTEFLAMVSHEMRTPLNGILGLTELMTTNDGGKYLSQDIEQLKQSGRYLLELINDTLDVSNIENGKMELHPSVCDGKTAFQNVIAMAKPGMDAKRIRFNMKTGELPFTKLYIDVGRAEQAIINVLSNAVKFTPVGGQIDFEMENVSNKDGVITDRITIRDNGIGMSKEFVAHLFEPFTQEHSDSRTAYRGTGLGMTIAKQSIELMGGSISVKSEIGKGTEVAILLPMPIATAAQLEEWNDTRDTEELAMLRGKRILLCEDHPLNAQIVIRLLERKGMRVEHAENGKIGVETFAASTQDYYDAILMDIRMPVMNGLEATRRIRKLQRRDARRVPIIALTANALKQDVKNALDAGMTEHLGKPVEPSRLYHTLAELIEHPNPFEGKKILVVDDMEMNRKLVRKAIEGTYTVLEAGSGVEALAMLNDEKEIAAVVTDIQMPAMDGNELIRTIRADSRFDHVAILANTIYGDHRQEDELLSIGANDFVYKPASPHVLRMRLEHILRNME